MTGITIAEMIRVIALLQIYIRRCAVAVSLAKPILGGFCTAWISSKLDDPAMKWSQLGGTNPQYASVTPWAAERLRTMPRGPCGSPVSLLTQ